MNKVIINIIILLLPFYALGQDTCIMTIHTAGIEIGETEMVAYDCPPHKEHYRIHSNSHFFGIYQVEYRLEVWYTHHQLDSSIAYYKVNKRFKHHCIIQKHDSTYSLTLNNDEANNHSIPALDSYCRIFFHKTHPPEHLYSEYDGETKRINYVNDSTFQIITNNERLEATYYLKDSIIQGGFINHSLLKFHLTKK